MGMTPLIATPVRVALTIKTSFSHYLKFSFIKNALIHFFLFVNFEIHGIC